MLDKTAALLYDGGNSSSAVTFNIGLGGEKMDSKNYENQVAESTKRECDAIVKVLDVLDSCPVPVTQTEVVRRVCKENAFLGVRKLGPLFHVMVIEHNRGIDTTYSNT